ncbi:MAG: tRNA uridine-5-carboxymethylaminomethyl(34) synthesis GTPase MnmE [Firmicutes bacterium]|nr:tRNA uridine-5-carboxymethylaminomethyl(34) synthesis GTPase MnmE [Bacillota bacterium]
MSEDTIAAIATALGEASIAVIRVSGAQAIATVDRIFSGRQRLAEMASHTVQYGRMRSLRNRTVLDEVLITVMHAPHTYTTEDVVEISTHGGIQSVQAVLTEVLRAGARMAEPGEFTKRAFLGGRIDLAQAEGVMELIRAESTAARSAALRQVEGSLTARVKAVRQDLLSLMAHIEVTLDYPEHDEEEATARLTAQRATAVEAEISTLLQMARGGRILREGLRTVIAGKPNVGKSSLLNQLAMMDRAIVTDVPGTTRDVIEEWLSVGGVALRVSDTAGLRETDDVVERLGVGRSRAAIESAQLLLIVLDASRPLDDQDRALLTETPADARIVLLNKADLPAVVTMQEVERLVDPGTAVIVYSAVTDEGRAALEQAIVHAAFGGDIQPQDATFVANARHIALFEQCRESLLRAIEDAQSGATIDLVAADVREAWVTLGEVIGETPGEDLLDQIFTQFCLGK